MSRRNNTALPLTLFLRCLVGILALTGLHRLYWVDTKPQDWDAEVGKSLQK